MIVRYYDISESSLATKAVEPGAVYFCNDSGAIYFDSPESQDRSRIASDIFILGTESDRTSLLAPIPERLYCVISSGSLYMYYGGKWIKFGSRPQIHFKNVAIENNTLTISDDRILSSDTAIFVPDLSVSDLVDESDITVSCSDGSVTVTMVNTPYDIPGEVIVN